jgi:hypothetical protein
MTAIPLPSSASAPVPVLELNYATAFEPLPALTRVGGVIGFIACALSALYLPMWMEYAISGVWALPSATYLRRVYAFAPIAQGFLGGIGLTLVLVGKYINCARLRIGVLIALLLNLAALGVGVREAERVPEQQYKTYQDPSQARWTSLSCPI